MSDNLSTPAIGFNYNFADFNPEEIETDETINAVFVVDTSISIQKYVKDLNDAFNDFTETMQKSHVAPKLFVSIVEFDETVKVTSGFQPISNIPTMDFGKKLGPATSLYDAVNLGVTRALDYRKNQENSGVNCKTLIFVITDGDDNNSKDADGRDTKKLIEAFKSDERGAFTFTTIMFGVGTGASFKIAKDAMGIEHLGQVGTTGAELRKMIGFISQSISSVSSNQQISGPSF